MDINEIKIRDLSIKDLFGYVDSWQIRDAKDVHPSHITCVIDCDSLLELIVYGVDKGMVDKKTYMWFKEIIKEITKDVEF